MSLRKLILFSMVAALCTSWPMFSQVNGIEVGNGATAQIFGGKSPSVKVTDAENKELASIPIEQDPDIFVDMNSPLFKNRYVGIFAYSKTNNTLYVLHNEKKGGHSISAVNLTTNRVDKKIPGGGANLLLSSDDRKLYFYGVCHPAISCLDDDKSVSDYDPYIKAIDTASNQVTTTYLLSNEIQREAFKKRNAYYVIKFLATSENRVIIQSEVRRLWNGKDESLSDLIMGFSGNSSKPIFTLNAGFPLKATMLSKDQKLLFAAIEGNKKTNGALAVFDLEKETSSQQVLTDHPTILLRFGAKQEPWVLGNEEMRAFSETGELTDKVIPLNKPRKQTEGSESSASVFLNGFPGETISLGDDRAAMLIDGKNGFSQHRLALIDLKKLEVDAIIPTLSASEISKIRTDRFLLALTLTAATLGNVIFTPNMTTFSNESLAARPDGKFLFSLDLDGHEVTVIDVPAATVVKRIPVNSSVYKLQVSTDGKHLICVGSKPQRINLETNNLEN